MRHELVFALIVLCLFDSIWKEGNGREGDLRKSKETLPCRDIAVVDGQDEKIDIPCMCWIWCCRRLATREGICKVKTIFMLMNPYWCTIHGVANLPTKNSNHPLIS